MSVLGLYIGRRFALLLMMTAIVLTMLSLTFELLEEAESIIKASGGNTTPVLWYTLLRVPDVASKMLPISALLAALTTIGLMIRHNELVALWSSGVSGVGVMRLFLPVAGLLCVLQFALDDRLVPPTLTRLYEWGVGDFRRSGMVSGGTSEVWLLSGDDIVRLPVHNARTARLEDLTIFRRDAAGVLQEQWHAATAAAHPGGWMLYDVSRYSVAPARGERVAEVFWPGRIDVTHLSLIAAGLRELSLSQLLTLIENQGFGQRPTTLAITWAHSRIANSLGPLLVTALVVACSQIYHRRGGFGIVMLSSLAIGFAYFILDNIGLALGESGFLSPWFAAWSSKIVLICAIGSLMLRHEA